MYLHVRLTRGRVYLCKAPESLPFNKNMISDMTDENYEDEYNTDTNRFRTVYLTWICLLYVKELTTTKIT